MSSKNKGTANNSVKTENVVETTEVKETEIVKKDKAKKQPKVKKQSKVSKKLKETSSELKKVVWPSFSKVVKQTGVVLAVVIIFTIILFGIDRLLSWIFSLLASS
ncbi:MAG: preprotein translocase subunit SecE [Christensenellales bacterium]|jgi:preprotein translocase subunit SecE